MSDDDLIVYLEVLEKAGNEGFTPLGWLYTGVLNSICDKRLAHNRSGTFLLSDEGADYLQRHRRHQDDQS